MGSQIHLPEGVDYVSSSVRPRSLGSPVEVGPVLNWNSVDLTSRKSYTFKVKVNVDNCAPARLAFRALVVGGTCNVDAEPMYANVKRSKKSKTCAPTKAPTTSPTSSPTTAPTTSPTSGYTWTGQPSAGSRDWGSIASSSDGTVRRVCWGGASRKAYDANDDVAAARSRG